MDKVKRRVYALTFLLTLGSLLLVLLNSGRQREFFYIATYLSIIGLLLDHRNINLRRFSIAYPLLLIGVAKVIWYLIFELHHEGINFYSDHLSAGKKIILGSILVFYLEQFRRYLSVEMAKKGVLLATGASVLLATAYGFWQHYQGMGRVEMGINRATISAYIYSAISLTFIWSLYSLKNKSAYIIAAAMILLTYALILATGTRSVIGLYLIFIILMTLNHFKKIHIKSTVVMLALLAGIVALAYKPFISPKINQTLNEVTLYQKGNDKTSLGARFSMWAVGIHNGITAPLGQSMEQRQVVSQHYVEHNPLYASAMTYINVHMHNETIDTFSLQGIAGTIVLLFFYISLITHAVRNNNTVLLFATIMLVMYGLTDVLLISAEAVTFFITLFGVSTLLVERQASVKPNTLG
ncbi:O-antigen ligase family protein [Cronobacter universalis]|nr:O-antigen ligase family protein [Cronobacter universalis]